jgi:DNA-binding beta-propeller fold protein YncE
MRFAPSALILPLIALFFTGCVQQYGTTPDPVKAWWGTHAIFVVDEGNFGKSNAAVDCYDLAARALSTDVFAMTNGSSIGDNANGAILAGDSLFVVVNNSDKIVLLSRSTATLLRTYPFAPGTSPYAMIMASDSQIAVTSLYGNEVLLLNVHTGMIDLRFPVGNNPQSVAKIGNALWVASPGFSGEARIDIIDLSTHAVRQVVAARNPVYILRSPQGTGLVLCSGMYNTDSTADIPGAVQCFDASTQRLLWSANVAGHPFKMAVGGINGLVVVPAGMGLTTFDAQTGTMLSTVANAESFYGVAVDSVTGHLWATDAKDFQQRADLVEFSGAGVELTRVSVGVNPGTLVIGY